MHNKTKECLDEGVSKLQTLINLTKDLYILPNAEITKRIGNIIKFINDFKELDWRELFAVDVELNEDGKNENNLQILNKQVYGKFLSKLKLDQSLEAKKTLLNLFKHISETNIELANITEATVKDSKNPDSKYSKLQFYNDSAVICKYMTTIIDEHFAKYKDDYILAHLERTCKKRKQ